MTTRYERMFSSLSLKNEGAFVPFVVLGDPDPAVSHDILSTLARSGADALELGIPFSDPVADGPTIQKADQRALAAGTRPSHAWSLVRELRRSFPDLPIGLLVYANLVEAPGRETFYATAREAGVDSVLVADVPVVEARPYVELAGKQGVAPVLIATPNSTKSHLTQIATLGKGYTYVVTRSGVTGADDQAQTEHRELIRLLASLGAPPCLLGFGISRPEHVAGAIASGAAGAISGSAVVRCIEESLEDLPAMLGALARFVTRMKAATRR